MGACVFCGSWEPVCPECGLCAQGCAAAGSIHQLTRAERLKVYAEHAPQGAGGRGWA